MRTLTAIVASVATIPALAKEVPPNTDIEIPSRSDLMVLQQGIRYDRIKLTSLATSVPDANRASVVARSAELTAARPAIDALRINRSLLGMPTAQEIDPNVPSMGLGVPRQFAQLSLAIEGQEFILFIVDEAYDAKRNLRHLTAAVLNHADSYARFTVDDGTGSVAGTLRTSRHAYRFVPAGKDTQLVYRLNPAAQPAGQAAAETLLTATSADAATLERRHVQMEVMAEINPQKIRMARNGLSVNIEGGNLGRVAESQISTQAVLNVLSRLEPLTNVKGNETIRITRSIGRSEQRIKFEQLIDGIPVARRNELIVNADGTVRQIRASIVDPARAPQQELMTQARAYAFAVEAVNRAIGRAQLSQVLEPRLYLHVSADQYELIPKYDFMLEPTGQPTYRVSVNALTGETSLSKQTWSAAGDDFRTHVYRTLPPWAPASPSDPGAGNVIIAENNAGSASCMIEGYGSYACFLDDVQAAINTSIQIGRDWESVAVSDNACCELMNRPLPIILNTPAAVDGASYNGVAILFDPAVAGLPDPRNVDVMAHEHLHAYFHNYNNSVSDSSALFNRSVGEGLADAMAAAYVLKHPVSGNSAWIFGDGAYPLDSNYQRDLSQSRDLADFATCGTDEHECGKIIGNFFYRLYAQGGISADRLMSLILQVADGITDADGNGLDVEDFQEAVFSAVNYTEVGLIANVLTVWNSMENPTVLVPSAPAIVDGVPMACAGGFSTYTVVWSASPNAAAYAGYLREPNGITYIKKALWSRSTTSSPAYTNFNTDARIEACNGAGCSGMSVDSFPMPHICF
jgi:hypothetical protein